MVTGSNRTSTWMTCEWTLMEQEGTCEKGVQLQATRRAWVRACVQDRKRKDRRPNLVMPTSCFTLCVSPKATAQTVKSYLVYKSNGNKFHKFQVARNANNSAAVSCTQMILFTKPMLGSMFPLPPVSVPGSANMLLTIYNYIYLLHRWESGSISYLPLGKKANEHVPLNVELSLRDSFFCNLSCERSCSGLIFLLLKQLNQDKILLCAYFWVMMEDGVFCSVWMWPYESRINFAISKQSKVPLPARPQWIPLTVLSGSPPSLMSLQLFIWLLL